MGRLVIGILVFIDVWIALCGLPFLVLALAWLHLETTGITLAALVFGLCWVIAPWAALVIAWQQSRRGAGRGRIAITLAVPVVLAMIGGSLLGILPMQGV
jgi:hypothetical protein